MKPFLHDTGHMTVARCLLQRALKFQSPSHHDPSGGRFPYRKLLAGFRPVESGESRNGVCSLGSAGKALLCSSSTRLYDLTLEIRLDIKDLKDTKGKFDKEGLIHMFNMVLRG